MKEVVRQLRLRDIGGIIVIDFIDMANPKNRELVEEDLKQELERDRTKTYVVEISPLGLVEMTRQNVTDGPREILTKRCPTCAGDGIVVSETTSAVDAERRLRALAAQSPRTKAFKVELNAHVASMLIGPGAERLKEIEQIDEADASCSRARTARRSTTSPSSTRARSRSSFPIRRSRRAQELDVKLGEVGLHDSGRRHGQARRLRRLRRRRGQARREEGQDPRRAGAWTAPSTHPSSARRRAAEPAPITAEGLAEKPTRGGRPARAPSRSGRPSRSRRRPRRKPTPRRRRWRRKPEAEPETESA